jgi:hypothetical protein
VADTLVITPGTDCKLEYRRGLGIDTWYPVEVCGEWHSGVVVEFMLLTMKDRLICQKMYGTGSRSMCSRIA